MSKLQHAETLLAEYRRTGTTQNWSDHFDALGKPMPPNLIPFHLGCMFHEVGAYEQALELFEEAFRHIQPNGTWFVLINEYIYDCIMASDTLMTEPGRWDQAACAIGTAHLFVDPKDERVAGRIAQKVEFVSEKMG